MNELTRSEKMRAAGFTRRKTGKVAGGLWPDPDHWHYEVLAGKWVCHETGEYGTPEKGDWYVDIDEWRRW